MRVRAALPAAAVLLLLGTAPRTHAAYTGSFKIDVPSGPYIAGSRLTIATSGITGPVSFSVLGPGHVRGPQYVAPAVPRRTGATLIGSAPGAVAMRRVDIAPPPPAGRSLIAVASYRDGIALHDPRTFRLIGYLPIGGAPGDVAFGRSGELFAPDTDSDALASVSRAPWRVRLTHGVDLGNEVAVDRRSGDVFVSDRDTGSASGALTRISPDGAVARVKTGAASEGLAIDAARGLVYVGNVASNSVSVVNARTMRVVRTIPSVPRTFGMALDEKLQRLFVVANTSPSMPSHAGFLAAIDVGKRNPRVTLRSPRMIFPLGAALDAQRQRVFVTDEAANAVYVFSAKTLRPVHPPLRTCDTPWRPRVAAGRLYVPCANADKIDVFDLRTLRRVAGAPFTTGGYPLGVAVWEK